jgi:diacylglycerol kinase family enzyme
VRVLLVVNPKATALTTSTRSRDVLAHALASECRLEVVETKARGHATELARTAVGDGFDAVVALGGDGTVNEIVNGLLTEGPRPGLPALGVVPGGSTNVFARALGLPNEPVEATSELLTALHTDRRRDIGLGMVDDRWFTFNAGLGLDAAAVRKVEAKRARGRKSTPGLYIRSTLHQFYFNTSRRVPALTLERPGEDPLTLALALVCNTSPWTYAGPRAISPCPAASFETGLDVFGLRTLGTMGTLRHVPQIIGDRPRPRGRRVVLLHDLPELTLSCEEPLPLQVDGDDLGDRTSVRMRSVPSALSVLV